MRRSKLTQSQNVLTGALFLSLAAMVSKVIGAMYRIPLTNLLTESGMAYYESAYNVFTLVYYISVSGLSIAISKLVSENVTRGHFRTVRKIMRVATWLCLIIGAAGTLFVFLFAPSLARAIGNPGAVFALRAIAPTIFFGCILSIFRGYYQGMRNMLPTAVSQVVEALCKLAFGMALSFFVYNLGMNEFAVRGTVFGVIAATQNEAITLALPYAAAGGIAGVSISTFFAVLYMALKYKFGARLLRREDIARAPAAPPGRSVLRSLLLVAVPVCIAAAVGNLTDTIDVATVMNRLGGVMEHSGDVVRALYPVLLDPKYSDPEAAATFLYGAYRVAFTLYQLMPALTITFATSALPAISSSWSVGDKVDVGRNIETTLRVTMLLAAPAGLAFMIIPRPILALLYPNLKGTDISAAVLSIIGLAVIFVCVSSPVAASLQGIGRVDLPLKVTSVGIAIKLAVNYFLVGIPSVNVVGAVIGSVLCYAFIFVAELYLLIRGTGIRLNFTSIFVKPLFSAFLCGVAAYQAQLMLARVFSPRLATVVAIAAGALVYAVALLCLRGIAASDLKMLPGGERLARRLGRYNILS